MQMQIRMQMHMKRKMVGWLVGRDQQELSSSFIFISYREFRSPASWPIPNFYSA
jgi:hypothetical protein